MKKLIQVISIFVLLLSISTSTFAVAAVEEKETTRKINPIAISEDFILTDMLNVKEKSFSGLSSQFLILEKIRIKRSIKNYEIEEYKARVITEETVTLYEYPDAERNELRKIPEGMIFNTTAKSGKWVQIKYNGETGWINIRKTEPVYSIDVDVIKQTTNYTCGSACSAMILETLDKPVDEIDFWNRANRNGYGTFVFSIRNNLNYFLGKKVYEYEDMSHSSVEEYSEKIEYSIKNGYPVMIVLKIPNSAGFGYDTDGHYVLIKQIYEVDGITYCTLNDPWMGGKVFTKPLSDLAEMNQNHSGYIICHPEA